MNLAYAGRTVTFLVACLLPALVSAQTELNPEAQWRFNRGVALVKEKAYVEAVEEFKRAHAISSSYTILFELGQAYAGAGQPVQAVEALGKYLGEGGARIPQARRQAVEATIAEQESGIATVIVRCDLSGAVIRLDGNEAGRCPLPGPVRMNAGIHQLEASLAGHLPQEIKLALAGKEQKVVDVKFETNAAGAPGSDTAPTLVSPTGAGLGGSRKTAAYVAGGLGVGAIVVGSVFGVRAITKRLDSNRHCPQNQCTQQGVDLNNQAKTAALVSDITLGVGLVGVAVAAYLLLRPGAESAPAPGTVAGGMELLPELGPGEAKLALRGVW
jgi:hypothetical protein